MLSLTAVCSNTGLLSILPIEGELPEVADISAHSSSLHPSREVVVVVMGAMEMMVVVVAVVVMEVGCDGGSDSGDGHGGRWW